MIRLFDLSPDLDRETLAARFAADGRVQVRDVLTPESATNLRALIARETPWGIAWQAGDDGPHSVRRDALASMPPDQHRALSSKLGKAMAGRDYGFIYSQYPMLKAMQEGWDPDGPHDIVLEHLNDEPFVQLVRDISGMADLKKADGQATLYAPNQFLSLHDDTLEEEGWRVAYVLNLCGVDDWRPDWGGYLLFYDEDGDVVAGYKPRFNSLNLFAVPAQHNVTYVPAFAPQARFAITGWLRDR